MSRWRHNDDPDIMCMSYKTVSNRSTRLLLLEIVAGAWLKDHQELKNFLGGFGPKEECTCDTCNKAREVLRLKYVRQGWEVSVRKVKWFGYLKVTCLGLILLTWTLRLRYLAWIQGVKK